MIRGGIQKCKKEDQQETKTGADHACSHAWTGVDTKGLPGTLTSSDALIQSKLLAKLGFVKLRPASLWLLGR